MIVRGVNPPPCAVVVPPPPPSRPELQGQFCYLWGGHRLWGGGHRLWGGGIVYGGGASFMGGGGASQRSCEQEAPLINELERNCCAQEYTTHNF